MNLSKGYLLINFKATSLCVFSVTSWKILVIIIWYSKSSIIGEKISCLEKRGEMDNSHNCFTLQNTCSQINIYIAHILH